MLKAASAIVVLAIGVVAVQAGCATREHSKVKQPASTASINPRTALPDCTVAGAKHLNPALDDAAICTRFLAPLKAGLPAGAQAQVKLTIAPGARCEAIIAVTSPGRAPFKSSFGVAVSDRQLQIEDLEALARDAAGEIRKKLR